MKQPETPDVLTPERVGRMMGSQEMALRALEGQEVFVSLDAGQAGGRVILADKTLLWVDQGGHLVIVPWSAVRYVRVDAPEGKGE